MGYPSADIRSKRVGPDLPGPADLHLHRRDITQMSMSPLSGRSSAVGPFHHRLRHPAGRKNTKQDSRYKETSGRDIIKNIRDS